MHVFTTVPAAARRRPGTGLIYLVASGLLWGTGGLTGSLLSRVAGLPALSVLTVTGFGFTIGGLALMPLAVLAGGIDFRPGLEAIGLLIALGIGPTAVAYTLYFRGLRAATASTAALLTLLEPLTGAVLATFILGQRLSGTGIAGAVILAAAVVRTVIANRER